MRVSTNSIYDTGAAEISRRQAELAKSGERISSGRRLLTAADDPVGAAKLVTLSAAKARNDQLAGNQTAARNALSMSESVLGSVTDTYQDIRELLVQAGNGALSDADRKSIGQELSARRETLLSLANFRDANGAYVFGGYRESAPPFVQGAGGIVYQGDDNARAVQVSASRSLEVTQNGAGVFAGVKSGNGVFATSAASGNTGSATIALGQVVDAAALDGKAYSVVFRSEAGATVYDIVDTASGSAVSQGNAYTAGAPITVAGMQAGISGTPAAGDRFSFAPSTSRSAFDALDEAIALLNAPANSDAGRRALTQGLASVSSQVEQAFERGLSARSRAGAALSELDALEASTSARDVQYQTQMSEIADLDYAKELTQLSQRQLALQAAQQTYAKLLGKSMFDFL